MSRFAWPFSRKGALGAAPGPALSGRRPDLGAQVFLHGPGRPVWTRTDYASLAQEGVARNAIAYRCVRLIAESVASLPLSVRIGREIVPDHDLARLLANPNDGQSGIEFIEELVGYLQTGGNAFAKLGLVENMPRALWNVRPDKVRLLAGADGRVLAHEVRHNQASEVIARDLMHGRETIVHLRLFHPTHDHLGLSPLEAAASAIDVHNAGGAWNKALLDNAARPSGALIYKGPTGADRLSEEQFARLKSELERAHQGADNAGRPMLLEGGLDWRPMSLTPADMDFLAARAQAARDIALAFGVPPMLLGIPGDNTYATYREANLAFWRQVALPLAAKLAAGLTRWLSPWFGGGAIRVCVETDQCPALAEEAQARWQRLNDADFLSRDEKRALAGFGPCAHESNGEAV